MPSIAPPNHTRNKCTTDDWITPKELIDRLGLFDLDPCSSATQPWPCARVNYTVADDGFSREWRGMVWMNPPYGKNTGVWMKTLANYGNGIALIFGRTETAMFFESVWGKASAILFIRGRLTFCTPDGTPAPHNSGGPSVLIAYGEQAAVRLETVADLGAFVRLTPPPLATPG